MNILNSENFKKDQEKIQDFLSKTSNETAKKQISELYKKLIYNIKKIDQLHGDITYIGNLNDSSRELRSNIVEIRKKIFKKINESF